MPNTDFNGDGRDDILWRNDNGLLTDWLASGSGGFATNGGATVNVALGWDVAGTADFNGDGRDDILWRNTSGQLTDWLGTPSGGFLVNSTNLSAFVPINWSVAATGDYNGDGRADILWRQSTGQLTSWLGTTDGAFVDNSLNASTFVSPSWFVIGTGDFNGDGRDDILWRQDMGHLTNWLGTASGGFTQNTANFSEFVAPAWTAVATGDFNGDGRSDILWRDYNGQLTDWLGTASGGFIENSVNASVFVSNDWQIASVGDFNGDGRDDILWRDFNGQLTTWHGTSTGGFASTELAIYVTNDWHVEMYTPSPWDY